MCRLQCCLTLVFFISTKSCCSFFSCFSYCDWFFSKRACSFWAACSLCSSLFMIPSFFSYSAFMRFVLSSEHVSTEPDTHTHIRKQIYGFVGARCNLDSNQQLDCEGWLYIEFRWKKCCSYPCFEAPGLSPVVCLWFCTGASWAFVRTVVWACAVASDCSPAHRSASAWWQSHMWYWPGLFGSPLINDNKNMN